MYVCAYVPANLYRKIPKALKVWVQSISQIEYRNIGTWAVQINLSPININVNFLMEIFYSYQYLMGSNVVGNSETKKAHALKELRSS